MKHGTKPTREQKELLTKWRLDPRAGDADGDGGQTPLRKQRPGDTEGT